MTSGEAANAPLRDSAVQGLLIAAAGFGIIACADAAVKYMLPQVGVAGAMIWRGMAGSLFVLLVYRGRVWPKRRGMVWGRSLLHAFVAVLWYFGWSRGVGLADSYAVAALSPLLMTLLAVPMLGEKLGWRRITSCLLGFSGVLVMLQPGGTLWRWEASLLLVAVLGMAFSRVMTRVLARTDTAAAVAFWLLAAHIPLGLLLLPFFPPPVTLFPMNLSALLALGAFGCANAVAHLLFARAFALAPVGVLAPLEYSVLPWGAILGFLIFAELPVVTTWIGAAIVISAGVYNLHRERIRARERRMGERSAAEA